MKNCLLYLVTEDWYFLSHRINLALSAKDKGSGNEKKITIHFPTTAFPSHLW